MAMTQPTTNHDDAPTSDRLAFRRLTSLAEPGEMPPTMGGMEDERRRKILSDRTIHEAIRNVARLRGMPKYDVDVILDTVVLDAMDDPKLPLDNLEDARRYLVACARNKSIDDARKRGRRAKREVEANENEAAPGAVLPEDAALAARLVREGEKRFPRTFPWFLRHTIYGESHVKIAVEANVSPGHVRHEVYTIRNALRGFTAVAVLLAIVFSIRQWTLPSGQHVDRNRDLASTASAPVVPSAPPSASAEPTPAERAMALRESAKRDCANGEWDFCLSELEEANKLDAASETPEAKALRDFADKKLRSFNAKPH